MQLMKRLREIEAKAPLAKLKDIEGDDEKLRFMLTRWSLTNAARALKQWTRCVRADSIEVAALLTAGVVWSFLYLTHLLLAVFV